LGRCGTGTHNQIVVVMFRLPYAISISRLSCFLNVSGANPSHASFGVYDLSGTTLFFCWTYDTFITSRTQRTGTISPVTLPPGIYYYAFSSDSTTVPLTEGGYACPSSSHRPGETPNYVRTGVAANPTVAGVLPATLGLITEAGLQSFPDIVMEP
jgi:hypothetical protein